MGTMFDELSRNDVEDRYDIAVLVEVNELAEDENENNEIVYLYISKVYDEEYQHILGQPFYITTEEYESRPSNKLKIQVTEFVALDSVVEVIPLHFID